MAQLYCVMLHVLPCVSFFVKRTHADKGQQQTELNCLQDLDFYDSQTAILQDLKPAIQDSWFIVGSLDTCIQYMQLLLKHGDIESTVHACML